MIPRTLSRSLIVAITAAVVVAGSTAFAQRPTESVDLDRVVAVEEADSLFGQYRIVFTIKAPLPPARDAVGRPWFKLENQRIVLPGDPRDRTLLFGYFDRLPPSSATLTVVPGLNRKTSDAGEPAVAVDASALLSQSRPAAGSFEPPHIQRSKGVVDLVAAWDDANSVFSARFVRRSAKPNQKGVYELYFETDRPLREGGVELPKMAVFTAPTPEHILELGARYVLFARLDQQKKNLAADMPLAVRVWWPREDFVLQFLDEWSAVGGVTRADAAKAQRARTTLVRSLSSPAAEIRRTAALQLRQHPFQAQQWTADELNDLAARQARDPSPPVKQAIQQLIDSATK